MNNQKLFQSIFLFLILAITRPSLWSAGKHAGEADRIEASVTFQNSYGYTTTDANGIYYHVWGMVFNENKIYPAWTYGINYPLYFIGTTMSFTVTLKNVTPQGKKTFRVRVAALNNVLETNGSMGMSLAAPQEWIIEDLGPGQTRTLQGSVYIAPDPNLPSGLDITKIRISHLNQGNNEDAGLIKEEIAVWCPPKERP